jgi:hypothetical protein
MSSGLGSGVTMAGALRGAGRSSVASSVIGDSSGAGQAVKISRNGHLILTGLRRGCPVGRGPNGGFVMGTTTGPAGISADNSILRSMSPAVHCSMRSTSGIHRRGGFFGPGKKPPLGAASLAAYSQQKLC